MQSSMVCRLTSNRYKLDLVRFHRNFFIITPNSTLNVSLREMKFFQIKLKVSGDSNLGTCTWKNVADSPILSFDSKQIHCQSSLVQFLAYWNEICSYLLEHTIRCARLVFSKLLMRKAFDQNSEAKVIFQLC